MPTDVVSLPLADRVVLVTGVSRQVGIALAVAAEMHRLGATVFATGWRPHDDAMPWGAGPSVDAPFGDIRHARHHRVATDTPQPLPRAELARPGPSNNRAVDPFEAAHTNGRGDPAFGRSPFGDPCMAIPTLAIPIAGPPSALSDGRPSVRLQERQPPCPSPTISSSPAARW